MNRSLPALLGAALLVVLGLAALLAPYLAADPEALTRAAQHLPAGGVHQLGTVALGRDLLSRLLHGGRVSLAVALATAVLASVLGTAIGLLAGYGGGRLDAALMRLTDGVMALPLLPLLIVLAALDPAKLGIDAETQASEAFVIGRLAIIIALVGWTGTARLVRAQTLTVKTRDYVRAATALGVAPARIMLVHILPGVASPMVVAATLSVGNIILVESALSFLGLGVQPPDASWGNMLLDGKEVLEVAPWLSVFPGLAILFTVLGYNLLGESLRDLLDPRLRR